MSDEQTSAEYLVTANDLRSLATGEGGVDLAPVVVDDEQIGMRLFGVSPGSTAARLGGRNGDVVQSINDVPLTSVSAAYAAGAGALGSKRIVIRGTRRGVPFTTVLLVA